MEKNKIGTVAIPFFYKEQFTDILLKSGYIVEVVKEKRIFDDDEKEKDAAIITIYYEERLSI